MAVQPEPDFTDRIREAALQLFSERGYGTATVEAIAQAAGVGVGTIYRRWPDKPALANYFFAWVESSIIDAVTGKPLEGRTGKQQFLELWRRTWDFSAQHPDRVVFIEGHTHEAFLDDENRAMKNRFLMDIARRFDQMRAPCTATTRSIGRPAGVAPSCPRPRSLSAPAPSSRG